jgi:hypothetical protein
VKLTAHQRTEIKRDGAVFLAALLATGVVDDAHPTRAAVTAAVITAAKVTARKLLPHDEAGA